MIQNYQKIDQEVFLDAEEPKTESIEEDDDPEILQSITHVILNEFEHAGDNNTHKKISSNYF